jgi:adenine-specific DNA-methyltransferase
VLGNIDVLNGKDQVDKYIMIKKFPSGTPAVDAHLTAHKAELLTRGIRKFTEKNWFEWGAPRNMGKITTAYGQNCIYIKTLTRQPEVAFVGKVMNVGGGLLIMIPRQSCDLQRVVDYLNSDTFKSNFLFAGRFKIGQRQLSNSLIPC